MGSPFRTREFLRLFDEWNNILNATGFKDAEDFSLPEPALKSWHGLKWQKARNKAEETLNYYGLARDLLSSAFPFKSRIHKQIWSLHAQGLSARKIASLVNTRKFNKTTVHVIIVDIQKSSGIKR